MIEVVERKSGVSKKEEEEGMINKVIGIKTNQENGKKIDNKTKEIIIEATEKTQTEGIKKETVTPINLLEIPITTEIVTINKKTNFAKIEILQLLQSQIQQTKWKK